MPHRIDRSTWCLFLALGCTALALVGCTSPLKLDRRKAEGNNIAYALACEPFAAMSALVYSSKARGEGIKEEAELRAEFETKLARQGWSRDDRYPLSPVALATGLSFEVWVNTSFQKKVVVIAVRGTEFDEGNDWWANSHWITRFSKRDDQYKLVNHTEEIGRVFANYRGEIDRGETVVITTGHSLGGGLAQAIRYRYMSDVVQCYAFNTSPVTTFTEQEDHFLFGNLPPVAGFPAHLTLRIYERGEILAYLRAPLRLFRRIPDQIREVRFNFTKRRNFVSQHSMFVLAKHLEAEAHAEPHKRIRVPIPWWRLPKSTPTLSAPAE